jgi:hypothetical protein
MMYNEITEEEIGDYLEMIFDPDFDIDAFEGVRELIREENK